MNLPPQLSQELELLKTEGYNIEVSEESSSFCVVFKDYNLPEGIWNKDKTDLLIIAQTVYPNAKLDMFWVAPGLKLADGRMPQAGDVEESHCGKTWQRFSWHAEKWNPARDNITTYLELINHRLKMRK